MQDVLDKSTVATIVIYGSSCGSPCVLFGGTTVNDSETIGRTNGVNHRQSTAERFVHNVYCRWTKECLCVSVVYKLHVVMY